MADSFGLNFAPLDSNNPNRTGPQGQGAASGSATPIQDAIQTLSLNIPHVVGASALAPSALLNSPGGSGLGGGLDLEALLRRLFGQPAPPGSPTSSAGPAASAPMSPMAPMTPPPAAPALSSPPPPNITPGNGGTTQASFTPPPLSVMPPQAPRQGGPFTPNP